MNLQNMPKIKRYVVGFCIEGKRVLLIEKNRPEKWKGLITGPGGKYEDGESGQQAMAREWLEETGNETQPSEWTHVATVRADGYDVDFFRIWGNPRVFKQVEDEVLFVADAYSPPANMFDNARWALALALDAEILSPVVITYHARAQRDRIERAGCEPNDDREAWKRRWVAEYFGNFPALDRYLDASRPDLRTQRMSDASEHLRTPKERGILSHYGAGPKVLGAGAD